MIDLFSLISNLYWVFFLKVRLRQRWLHHQRWRTANYVAYSNRNKSKYADWSRRKIHLSWWWKVSLLISLLNKHFFFAVKCSLTVCKVKRKSTSLLKKFLETRKSFRLKTTRRSSKKTRRKCFWVSWFCCNRNYLAVKTSTDTRRIMNSTWAKTSQKVRRVLKAREKLKRLQVQEWWANCLQLIPLLRTRGFPSILTHKKFFWN